jgi:hypothetical protein
MQIYHYISLKLQVAKYLPSVLWTWKFDLDVVDQEANNIDLI